MTAYLLGLHSRADSLAVAMGPADTINSMLINSMVFAFVPMLAAETNAGRTRLFLRLRRAFVWVFPAVSLAVIATAGWLMRVLAPGLDAEALRTAIDLARILALSTSAAGIAALYWALLYTERRFAPTAFYQATLNLSTIAAAIVLWKELGVYAFALGYTLGAAIQLAYVHIACRSSLRAPEAPAEEGLAWRQVLAKPAFFVAYAAGLGLNVTFTRAYATHAGPGMAAAFEYCMRVVGVPLAILVSPMANSLLPEIARLRSLFRLREAFPLIDRTIVWSALASLAITAAALLLRHPVIALLFQRGSFTAESTSRVSAVFLGFGPVLVGWTLIEIAARSLFALERPWLPLLAAFVPVTVNAGLTLAFHSIAPERIGMGASSGAMAGAALLLLMVYVSRSRKSGVRS